MSMKKLGFGLMRLPLLDANDAGSIDIEQTKQMVDAFLANGFTYFDTAWMYCAFQSEHAAKTALVDRHSRDSFTLATKLHSSFIENLEDRDRIFNEQCAKTGVDYFDYYLLHAIETASYGKYEALDCFRWMQDKKAQGLMKHIGFSYHDNAELLDRVLTEHPEVDFVQLQINYLDWDSEWTQSRQCYEVCVKHKKPVVVMEPVKGGMLAQVPEQVDKTFKTVRPELSIASWGIRFAASLENVMVVLSGMSNMEQLEDNMSYMKDFQPLSAEESDTVRCATDLIRSNIAVPCTGCSYCTEGCPMEIAIPKYFSLYNADHQEGNDKRKAPNARHYDKLTETFGKASACVECGQCEDVCPQHLPIIQHLKEVATHYEQ